MTRYIFHLFRWRGLATAAAIVGSVVVAATAAFQVPEPSGFGVRRQDPTAKPDTTRKITRERGRPITSRLRSNDVVVEIVDEQPAGTPPPPPPPGYPGAGESYVQRITEKRVAALLVRVLGVRGALTRAGDAVETFISAEVIEVRKNALDLSINSGDKVQLTGNGGEAVVGKTRIVDRDRTGSTGWNVGKDYFVFVISYDGVSLNTSNGDWLAEEGGHFMPINGHGKLAFRDANLDKESLLHEVSTYSLVRK